MQLYENTGVELTYQNFGSAWLGILRGSTEQINLTFNGLFNLRATNGEMEFQDHLETIATFWTDRRAMRRFFFNRFFIPRCMGNRGRGQGKLARMAMRYAWRQLEAMTGKHEAYLNHAKYLPETYSTGTVSAERPDADMKDAVLAHAFKTKEDKAQKTVDTE